MEAKLWTYGCSFTQGMWEFDFKGDSINNRWYEATDNSQRKEFVWGSEDNWVDYLGDKLKVKANNKGLEGSGIIEVFDTIMKDTYDWKTNDYIIIQLPLIVRQFDTTDSVRFQNDEPKTQLMLKRWSEGIFHIMEKTNLKWFWWMTENPELNQISNVCPNNRLTFPSDRPTYKDWMYSDHSLFYDSYVGEHCVDYHQNKDAHIRQAEFFYEQIRNR